MQSFHVEQVIADVARAKNDLALLGNIAPDRLARCSRAVADLEAETAATLVGRWIPNNADDLTLSIRCVNDNIRRVQSQIDDCILDVIDRGQLDEYLRVSVACAQARLLELQLSIMQETLIRIMPKAEWIN